MSEQKEPTTLEKMRWNIHYESKYPTTKTASKWKWRKYKCKECGAEVPYNQLIVHASEKHTEIWRKAKDTNELFETMFEMLPIPENDLK